ncbi:hypothetical protein Tco_0990681 [Tanacetum coccineum]|uniref:Uncharacterized protein n=1 Tax=Tanacetum coccineum TaxID=301880 RepID=A0ABQ5EYI4_9ASTR
MSWFSRCSWCGGPFDGGNCWQCTNVSFEDEFVRHPDPISNDETPDLSYPPSQPQTSSFDQFYCFECGDPLEDGYSIDHHPQSIQEDLKELSHKDELFKTMQSMVEMFRQQEQAANLSTYSPEPLRRFNSIYYDNDDDEERTIPLNEIFSQIPPSIAITPVLPTMELEDSLSIGDENLSTIPEKESDEFIKSSVEDLVPILSESEDTSDNDSEYDLPFCDDSSPLDVLGENFVTFFNPLFNDNNAFTSSDDGSLPEEDVPKENFKIYSNPLFEFDDEYISSDVNPLFNEMLEDIENKDSYVSNLDEQTLLVTPLSDANEDECFDPGGKIDEIDAFLDMDISTDIENGVHDSKGDIIYLESLLINDTIPNLPLEVTDIQVMDKNEAKRTKLSMRLEEREKSKPKAYSFFMGQPSDPRAKMMDLEIGCKSRVEIEGLKTLLKAYNLPLPAINRGKFHTVGYLEYE